MSVRTPFLALAVSAILLSGCGDDPLGPGEIARPLIGSYTLESRRVVAQDSTATELVLLSPPTLRSSLVLNNHGRYARVDTLTAASTRAIFVDTGRWSVVNDQFFSQSDTWGPSAELYTFDNNQFFVQADTRGGSAELYTLTTAADGVRLTRTIPNQLEESLPSKFFKVINVWRKL